MELENIEGLIPKEHCSEMNDGAFTEYIQELKVSEQEWASMNSESQLDYLKSVVNRVSENGLPEGYSSITEYLSDVYGVNVRDAYEKIEAPYDNIQIERIANTIENMENLQFSKWEKLPLEKRLDVLNELEEKIADIACRTPCFVNVDYEMESNVLGGYSMESKDITLNADFVMSNNFADFKELLDTVVHEGRHAYQDYNLNECEVHPRHSEVESWRDTCGGGKWTYWNDTSSWLGQRLYEQQSIEIDARNFAADVIDRLEAKGVFYA